MAKSKSRKNVVVSLEIDAFWDVLPLWATSRFGNVTPSDIVKPSIQLAAMLRGVYDGSETIPDMGECLLYVLEIARRMGHTPIELCRAALVTAAISIERGREPHPQLPFVQPHTDIDHPANKPH